MTLPLGKRLAQRTDRRVALATGLMAIGGAAASRAGRSQAAPWGQDVFSGYGPLVPDPNPRKVIDLPAGFQYRILTERGDALSNGDPRPTLADAMAAYGLPGGRTLLVMNHENSYHVTANQTPVLHPDAYDHEASGGTTAMIVTPDLQVEYSYATSAGTVRNCAGGPTPWGTWLTCEETEHVPGLPNVPATLRHGYVFEVQPWGPEGAYPQHVRIPGMGRFNREAAAVDPATGIAYLTEDHAEGLFYRFVPAQYRPSGFGSYLRGGELQAMRIEQLERTWAGVPGRRPFRVGWVKIDDPDAIEVPTRLQGAWKGAQVFSRSEGMWYAGGAIWFTATTGGAAELGQIWRYVPGREMIELFYEGTDANDVERPDNITVHPTSGDLYVCEDGPGTDFIRLVTPEGASYPFARVAITPADPRQAGLSGTTDTVGEIADTPPDGRIDAEDAGACFSPDGRVLFFNIQPPSMTIAVWGPFRQGALAGGSGPGSRAMAAAAPPPGWLPDLGGALLARGAELGYSPMEVAALRHAGIPLL
jgi:secreted PhoX family phosphatase